MNIEKITIGYTNCGHFQISLFKNVDQDSDMYINKTDDRFLIYGVKNVEEINIDNRINLIQIFLKGDDEK